MVWPRPLLRPSLAGAMGCFIAEEMRRSAAEARDDNDMIYPWRAESGVDGSTPCVKYRSERIGWSSLGILLVMNDCSASFKWK